MTGERAGERETEEGRVPHTAPDTTGSGDRAHHPHPRLSINQATLKYSSVEQTIDAVTTAGIQAVGFWREPVQELGLAESAKRLNDSGLRYSTHCRGGWFTTEEGPDRVAAIDDNRRAIDEAATLAAAGAEGSRAVLVLVVGGLPVDPRPADGVPDRRVSDDGGARWGGSRDLVGARERVRDAVGQLAPYAKDAGVQLALEPLHPMFASDRSVLSTLGQALDIAADFEPATVGVTVDTIHLWWDPDLFPLIERAGREGRIASYQVCDWRTPIPEGALLGRHYPGDGVIDFASFTRAIEATGYDGDVEVELFNQQIWDTAPDEVLRRTVDGFDRTVAPYLR